MNKKMINGFFSNKEFFLAAGVFAGLFVLVALAYLFADENLGAHDKGLKGFLCTPEGGSCAGGIRITGEGDDGCTKSLITGKCSGTCVWCEPSNDKGRYCLESIEYNGWCVIDIPVSTMSCGRSRAHECNSTGGHGISGCCPEKDTNINLGEVCTGISTCIDIDD